VRSCPGSRLRLLHTVLPAHLHPGQTVTVVGARWRVGASPSHRIPDAHRLVRLARLMPRRSSCLGVPTCSPGLRAGFRPTISRRALVCVAGSAAFDGPHTFRDLARSASECPASSFTRSRALELLSQPCRTIPILTTGGSTVPPPHQRPRAAGPAGPPPRYDFQDLLAGRRRARFPLNLYGGSETVLSACCPASTPDPSTFCAVPEWWAGARSSP